MLQFLLRQELQLSILMLKLHRQLLFIIIHHQLHPTVIQVTVQDSTWVKAMFICTWEYQHSWVDLASTILDQHTTQDNLTMLITITTLPCLVN